MHCGKRIALPYGAFKATNTEKTTEETLKKHGSWAWRFAVTNGAVPCTPFPALFLIIELLFWRHHW